MGAWGTGVFDNDTAADFAGGLEDCSSPEVRSDLLMITLRACAELVGVVQMDDVYEFDALVEQALAAAAYVADSRNGTQQFTGNSYAQVHDEESDAWGPIPLDKPSLELVALARSTTRAIIERMHHHYVNAEWIAPAQEVLAALS